MRLGTKKIAYLGILITLAFIFSYIEAILPFNLGVPGAKLGLANLVVIVALYTISPVDTLLLSMVRILLVAMTFGNMTSMMYSLAGGLLSYLVMLAVKRWKLFSTAGVSVLGGVFHNVGQILVAMAILETKALIYYLPVLVLTGVVSGTAIGVLGAMVIRRISSRVQNF